MLEQLMPKEVFHYFEQLCNIPHGSGNIKQISDYLVSFAKERGLFCIQDEVNNVIIVKEATQGYENEPPIIIQGHMDMVAVKEDWCSIDMEKDGLKLAIDGDYVYAEGTSLGGDDGVAVAYALAVLDSNTISHPRLEVVITVDEETGMEGALVIDLSMLKGKRLLNIDSEKQGELTVSCAGGIRVGGEIPFETVPVASAESKVVCNMKLTGLTGGHSGVEIHLNRANANVLMGNILHKIKDKVSFELININGGTKDNAIPVEAMAEFVLAKSDKDAYEQVIKEIEAQLLDKFSKTDSGLTIRTSYSEINEDADADGIQTKECMVDKDAESLINFLITAPNGVQAMSKELEGLVETSLNLGIVRTNGKNLEVAFALRSSKKDAKDALCKEVVQKIESVDGTISLSGDYPAWEYKSDSKLVGKMSRIYEDMFGEKPKVLAIHAGLECGILADKIEGLDSVSFGPDIFDIHTTNEKLSISSTEKMWNYLLAILQDKTEEE